MPWTARANRVRAVSAYTLIELLIAMAIASLFLTSALPGLSYLKARHEAYAVTLQLYDYLQAARKHAIATSDLTTFCGANALGQCRASGFTHLQIFIDHNHNKQHEPDEPLIAHTALMLQGDLRINTNSAVKFNHMGRSNVSASFIYCPQNRMPKLIRRIVIQGSGRAAIAPPDDNGIVRNRDTSAITCTGWPA